MATGRPGCGPRSGLTRPSLGPGTTYTVSPRGFPTPPRPRASVIRTSRWPFPCVTISRRCRSHGSGRMGLEGGYFSHRVHETRTCSQPLYFYLQRL